MGSRIPFPRTRAERQKTGDPRASVEERYGTFEEYRSRLAAACERLILARYFLREDADALLARAPAMWDAAPK
jgi:hypothetical protein